MITATLEWLDDNGGYHCWHGDDYEDVEDAIGELTEQIAFRGRGLGNVMRDGDLVAIVRQPAWVEVERRPGEWRNRTDGGAWQG